MALNLFEKLLTLSGESTVPVQLLSEDEALIEFIREGATQAEALVFVNENY